MFHIINKKLLATLSIMMNKQNLIGILTSYITESYWVPRSIQSFRCLDYMTVSTFFFFFFFPKFICSCSNRIKLYTGFCLLEVTLSKLIVLIENMVLHSKKIQFFKIKFTLLMDEI